VPLPSGTLLVEPIPSPFTIKGRTVGASGRICSNRAPYSDLSRTRREVSAAMRHALSESYATFARSWKLVLRLHSLAIITIEIPPISKTQFHLSPKIRLPMKTSK